MTVVVRGVILAAGEGSRLAAAYAQPKPLVQINGVPLAFRTIDALMGAGVSEVGVVVGYERALVREEIGRHPLARQIRFIDNPEWREPNGLSLRLAQAFTGEEGFILSMVDHVFDPMIVRRLLQEPPLDGVTLAVDRDLDRVFDMDDATKVALDAAGNIRSISKQLDRFDAVDCGLFRCSPRIYEALDLAFASGERAVSAGMQVLADEGRMRAMPVDGLYWQDVDTPEMFAEAERWLTR